MGMEGNCRCENMMRPSVHSGCANELNRSNSDASTLTAENLEDVLHRSADVMMNDSTSWTNEKHNLYLELLEASFVKKLYQSMGLLAQCSEQNKKDKNISQIQSINIHNGPEQNWCLRKINNHRKGDPLSSISNNSHSPSGDQCVYRLPKADMPEAFKLSSTENYEKEGTGQNFVDEEEASNTTVRVKRLKTALADCSSHNQIMPTACWR